MKKKSMTFAAAVIGLTMLMSACTQKQKLPQNPKDKEEYKDEEGNRWVYNSHGNFWMVYALMNSMNNTNAGSGYYAATPSYRYYPSNNSWTNATGTAKATPSSSLTNFATGSYRSANSSNSASSAVKTSSSRSSSSVNTGTSKSSSGKSFSVSRSSHSIGA